MKPIISFLVLGFFALSVSQNSVRAAGVDCQIDNSLSNGTNSVVFKLSPSPLELLKMLGKDDLKSPAAILKLLDSSITNPAYKISKSISSAFATLMRPFQSIFGLPIPPLPTCEFMWSTSELYCDNIPSSIQEGLCRLFPAIKNITRPITFPLPQLDVLPLDCEKDQPWGLTKIRAPEAWQSGANGTGVVVANVDSGVLATHQELRGNRRATFSWYDAYTPSNTVPNDETGHGTHTMGSVAGKTVGVAPGAQWIACKGCDKSSCGDKQLLACMQWMYCPDKNQNGLNCSTRPNVINHSWGGGVGDTKYQDILILMKNANIINFFSAGNSGPLCFSVVSPADGNGTQLGTISVGAAACNDNIGSYSSAGPSQAADYMGGLGVDIVAPGSNIYSAWFTSDNATSVKSGTSMSSPHAAGAAAVLLSADRSLTFDDIRNALRNTAYKNPNVNSPLCGGKTLLSTETWPNNVYGYGRIDLAAALGLPPQQASNTTTTTESSTA